MRRLCALLSLIVSAMPARVFAHGTVGDYTFLEPMVAEDANPKNEFDILRPQYLWTREGRQFSLGFSLEKVLINAPEDTAFWPADSPLVSLEIGSGWSHLSPRGEAALSGFEGLELFPKWAFLTVPEHQLRLSLAAALVLPTGSPSTEEQNHTLLGPVLLWAKGWGDLPNRGLLKYLRPFGFQGDVGYVPALGGAAWHEMFADNVIEYSLPYLSNHVKDIGLRWPLRNLYVYTEFNYEQLITGPPGEPFPEILITPGIAFMGRYLQLSVATRFALNRASVRDNQATLIGLVDLFIDDILPWANWTPM